MKKLDLGQVITILANVGVIAGIVFLGIEIQQNTQVSRGQAVLSIAQQTIDWMTAASQDEEWMRVYTFLANGGTLDDLSADDAMLYRWHAGITIRLMEARFHQAQLGIIGTADLDASGGTANTAWFRDQSFLAYWRSTDPSSRWSSDFIEFMETEVLDLR